MDFDRLPLVALAHACSYLDASEICKLFQSSKFMLSLSQEHYGMLWRSLSSSISPIMLDSLWLNISYGSNSRIISTASAAELKELARQISLLKAANAASWWRTRYHALGHPGQLDAMEGHVISTIFDRYVVVVSGWGQQGLSNVEVIDGMGLPRALLLMNVAEVQTPPPFRYGFTAMSYKNDFLIHGGCQEGGYSGDCNDLYKLRLTFVESSTNEEVPANHPLACSKLQHAPINHFSSVRAQYTSSFTTNLPVPISRGYHTSTLIRFNAQDVMLVWGGLHNRSVTSSLELYNIQDNEWTKGEYEGEEPSPRFGHSCIPLGANGQVDRLVFTGGSDGNDLLRNGHELRDVCNPVCTHPSLLADLLVAQVYVLQIIPALGPGQTDRLQWSALPIQDIMHKRHLVPGRCHTACKVGEDKILYFGGSANNSCRAVMLDLRQRHANAKPEVDPAAMMANIFCPALLHEEEPVKRVSSAATMVLGRYMMVFGGWNNSYRELGDVWTLDLCPGLEACRRHVYNSYPSLDQGFLQQGAAQAAEEEEEEEEEFEEDMDVMTNPSYFLQMLIQSLQNQQQIIQPMTNLAMQTTDDNDMDIDEEEEEEEDDDETSEEEDDEY